MAERPHDTDLDRDFAAQNGWDGEYETFADFDLPTYVGPVSFMKLPWVTDPAELRRREVDVAVVGAPFDDAVTHRPGARFGPRAIREAQYTSGSINSLQLDVEPFEVLRVVDAGDANIVPAWIERAHALIYRKVLEVAGSGAIPIVLGGDHSITWPSATAVAEVRRPGSIGIVHFDAHADTAADDWGVLAGHGTPMRRLIESGAVKGKNFVQVGLRGYWPPVETFQWMQAQGLRWHLMREIEERGAEAVVAQAIEEALDGARLHLPEPRHRRGRPGHGARDRHARTRRHAQRASCCGPSARSWPPSIWPAWTSSRCRRRTTTRRRPPWSPIARRSRRSAPWPSGARRARPFAGPVASSRPAGSRPPRPSTTATRAESIAVRPPRSGCRRGARPPVRPGPGRRSRRPRSVPRPGRPGRRSDPRARGRHGPHRRPAGRGRLPGHRGRPRSGHARPCPQAPGPRTDRRRRSADTRRGRPRRACGCRMPVRSPWRSSPSTRCWSCPAVPRSGPPSAPWPTTWPRVAWPWPMSGSRTPRTWPGSTGGSSSTGRDWIRRPARSSPRPVRRSTMRPRRPVTLTTIFEEGGQGEPPAALGPARPDAAAVR